MALAIPLIASSRSSCKLLVLSRSFSSCASSKVIFDLRMTNWFSSSVISVILVEFNSCFLLHGWLFAARGLHQSRLRYRSLSPSKTYATFDSLRHQHEPFQPQIERAGSGAHFPVREPDFSDVYFPR